MLGGDMGVGQWDVFGWAHPGDFATCYYYRGRRNGRATARDEKVGGYTIGGEFEGDSREACYSHCCGSHRGLYQLCLPTQNLTLTTNS